MITIPFFQDGKILLAAGIRSLPYVSNQDCYRQSLLSTNRSLLNFLPPTPPPPHHRGKNQSLSMNVSWEKDIFKKNSKKPHNPSTHTWARHMETAPDRELRTSQHRELIHGS